jgi:hypothetical protein
MASPWNLAPKSALPQDLWSLRRLGWAPATHQRCSKQQQPDRPSLIRCPAAYSIPRTKLRLDPEEARKFWLSR